jgi:hypothetical protein
MVTDARLKKLAKGVSAREAVDAFTKSRIAPESMSDADRARAAELEATIEAMFLMAAVDGHIDKAEISQLAGSIQAVLDLRELETGKKTVVDVGASLRALNETLRKEGWKARLDATAARLPSKEARCFAFRLAAGVALVDDHVVHAEAAAIDALAAALKLTSDESQEILADVQETLFAES